MVVESLIGSFSWETDPSREGQARQEFTFLGRSYRVDVLGILVDHRDWDERFALGMSRRLGIPELTDLHWEVIRFIRFNRETTGRCPTLRETCRSLGLSLAAFESLFPPGYLRGACALAGVAG